MRAGRRHPSRRHLGARRTPPPRPRTLLAGLLTLLVASALLSPSMAHAEQAPPTPASVTVTRADGTLTATWPAAANATGYHITYSSDNRQSWALAAYNHPSASVTIDGVSNSATYHVAVRALNTAGGSGWRNSAGAGPWSPPPPPATPASVTVTRADGTLTATWPAAANATGYHITHSSDNRQSWTLAAYNHTTTSITINATNNATYHVAVRALNTTGGSGWRNSAASGHYTPPEPVAAPSSVAIAANMTEVTIGRKNDWKLESFDVSWNAVSDAVSYQVQCANAYANTRLNVSFGNWTTCVNSLTDTSTTITSSEYSLVGLVNAMEFAYKVRVRAKNSGNVWGNWTESEIAWPVWRPGMPWVIKRGNGSLVLEWHQWGRPVKWGVKYRVFCAVQGATGTKCADNIDPVTGVNADGYVEATITDLDLGTSGTQAVQNDSSYYVTVEAFNNTGKVSTGSGPWGPLTSPAKFSNVTATRGDGTITVTVHRPAYTWLNSVQMSCAVDGGSSGPCPGSPFTVDLDNVWADSESFTINVGSANNSKAYAITAQGVNDLGTGAASDSVSAPAISSPAQITSVTATRGIGTITVSWTVPTGNYLSYDVQCSSDSGANWTATCTRGTGSVNGTTYSETLTGVSDSTAYTVRVRAKNNMGTAAWRQSAAIPIQPGRIASITLSRGNGTLALSWTVPASNGVTISGYDVQCSSDSGATWTATCTRGTGATSNSTYSETLTGVSNRTAYTVRARAKNANATGAWRESAAIAALAAPGAPESVSVNNSYLVGQTRTYPVNWNKPSSAASNESLAYEVQCSTVSNPTSTQWNNCGTVASTTSTNLSRTVGHYWISSLFKKIRVRTKKYSDLYSAWVEANTQYT